MGRPTEFSPDVTAAITEAVTDGCNFEDAAEAGGVDVRTLYRWLAREEEPFATFRQALTQARAEAKRNAIKAWRTGRLVNGDHDWRASMTYLERTYPDQYAPQQAVNLKVSKELDGRLDKLKLALNADAYEQALAALAGEDGGETPGGDQG